MKVLIKVEVRPTEDRNKVLQAVYNIFGEQRYKIEQVGDFEEIVIECDDYSCLMKFYNLLRKERILDSARQYLLRGRTLNTFTFFLNKQAAYVGHLSFCSYEYGESPLGSITVIIEASSPESFLNWLTPATVNGKPVNEESDPGDC